LETSTKEIESNKTIVAELNDKLKNSQDKINELNDTLLKQQQEQQTQTLNDDKLNEANCKIDDLNKQIFLLNETNAKTIEDLKNQLETSTKEFESNKILVNELNEQLKISENKNNELNETLIKQQQDQQQEQPINSNENNEKLNELHQELDRNKKQLNNLRIQLENAYKSLKEKEASSLQSQLENNTKYDELKRELMTKIEESEKLKLSNTHLKDVLRQTVSFNYIIIIYYELFKPERNKKRKISRNRELS
jgi:chromosome segregation ATPase